MTSPNYQAWDIEPLSGGPITDRKAFLKHLVGWAVLAPNSHNVQPWHFRIDPAKGTVDVSVPRLAILPASDKSARQAHISVGCAIENLLNAADAYGVPASYQLMEVATVYPDVIACLSLDLSSGLIAEPDSEKYGELLAMKFRRMNRSKYDPTRPLPDCLRRDMKIPPGKELRLSIIEDMPTRIAISEIQYLANRAVVARNDFRHELGDYFLPNNTDKTVGMPGNTFGLSDEMAEKMCRELKKTGPFDPDLAFGFAAADRDGIKSAPLVGVISAEGDTPADRMRSGIVFEAIANCAQQFGVAVAMHAAIVEVPAFSLMLKARLGLLTWKPMVIFRMGYATEFRPRAPRMIADDVIEFV